MLHIDNVDWEKARERHEAWWHGGVIDRVLLQVFAPKKDLPPGPAPVPRDPEQQWLDAEFRIRAFERKLARTYYAGDAFPYFDTQLGPGTLSTFLGARPEFQPNTVWYHPCVDDIPNATPPVFDENNRYWRFVQDLSRKGIKRFAGRALVDFPDLIENLDTISSLVGNRELLLALVDHPDKVHEFQKAILPLYIEYHGRLYEIIKDDVGGSCFCAFDIYGKGRIAKLQCDFSAMISPQMFEEFVVPYMEPQIEALDHTVYHWDGPCALQHEGPLLAMRGLQAIQWTPGAGEPWTGDRMWYPLYHRVRAAGKSLLLLGVAPKEAQELVEEFGPEGLHITTSVSSREEADDLVRRSYGWGKR
jgi:hypothetical protein